MQTPRPLKKPLKMPASLRRAQVRVGAGLLRRGVYAQEPSLGSVTDIVAGELDPAPGPEIGVAGTGGALFLDDHAKRKAQVSFGGQASHVDMIDVEGDGVCEFMDRGSWGVPACVMDHQGRVLWTYGGGVAAVDDMGAGDVNGDGKLEFAVGFSGGDGVHLLDSGGHKLWQRPDSNAWHVELVDTNGDGKAEVVNSNARGEMTVRDAGGTTVAQGRPPAYFSHFSICRWPTTSSAPYALLAEEGTLWVLRFDSTVAAQMPAPDSGTLGTARGVPVVLAAGAPPYFASLADFANWGRSILYLHDAKGQLVYQEVIAGSCPAIAALRLAGATTDTLLVGGTGVVWRYELAGPPKP
jgi:hypothetical protein